MVYILINTLGKIEERLDILESKIDQILELLNGDLKSNCDKMAGHLLKM